MPSTEEAIERLSKAITQVGQESFDAEEIRTLAKDILDEKHARFLDQGLSTYDKAQIMRGLMGALSHYEAEKEKNKKEKLFNTLEKHH